MFAVRGHDAQRDKEILRTNVWRLKFHSSTNRNVRVLRQVDLNYRRSHYTDLKTDKSTGHTSMPWDHRVHLNEDTAIASPPHHSRAQVNKCGLQLHCTCMVYASAPCERTRNTDYDRACKNPACAGTGHVPLAVHVAAYRAMPTPISALKSSD